MSDLLPIKRVAAVTLVFEDGTSESYQTPGATADVQLSTDATDFIRNQQTARIIVRWAITDEQKRDNTGGAVVTAPEGE